MEETCGGGDGGGGVLQGRYELGRVLGRGTFAKVHLARDIRTDRAVAMKIVSKGNVVKAGMMDQVKREISVMKLVSHPNIVELHEVMATKEKIYLAMELVRGGELFHRVSRGGKLREDSARRYFRQLITAVEFCHSHGVFHRDLKLENLLLGDDGNLKVADFGLSALANSSVRGDGLLHTTCGTPAYVAPEIVLKKGYDGAKVDIWSCGVILFTLLAGFLPFHADNIMLLYKKIVRGDFKCPSWFSGEARRLISKLLDPNPATRITIDKLVETPWFRKPTLIKRESIIPPLQLDMEESQAKKDEPERLNAFHLISLSEGLNLSPLFESDRREDGMRFATREPAEGVISRLEGVAARAAGRLKVTRSSAVGVRLEGEEKGMKGRFAVAAEILAVAPSLAVVEVRKDSGDMLEYQRFCRDELQPALKDIFWASPADCPPQMATV